MSSTLLQAQDAIRPIVGYGINEGIHLGLNYRMKNVQLYSGYGRFETSPTISGEGHIIWGGVQFFFGKKKILKSWYTKLGFLKTRSISRENLDETLSEFRVGREVKLSDKVCLAIDLGIAVYLWTDQSYTPIVPLGGFHLLYNIPLDNN